MPPKKSQSKSVTPPPASASAAANASFSLHIQSDDAIVLAEKDFLFEEQVGNKKQQSVSGIPELTSSVVAKTSSSSKSAVEKESSCSSSATNSKHDDLIDLASLFFSKKDNSQKQQKSQKQNQQQQQQVAAAGAGGNKQQQQYLDSAALIAAAYEQEEEQKKKQQPKSNNNNNNSDDNILVVGKSKNNDDEDDESSDSSWDEEPTLNRIGDVPLEWYKDSDHVGYDIEGRRILRPKETALDSLLGQTDDPNAFRTITDPTTGEKKRLSNKDLELLFNIQRNRAPNPDFTSEQAYDENHIHNFVPPVEFDPLNHPLARSNGPSKKSFVPSLSDTKKLAKEVAKRLKETEDDKRKKKEEDEEKEKQEEEEKEGEVYLMWDNTKEVELTNRQRFKMRMAVPKTKVAPPGTYESYRPPPEYLPSEAARLRFKRTRPVDRKEHFLPQRFSSLRHVPFYKHTIQDRYQRCLDLTMFPRAQRTRLVIDPEKLLPDLPEPKDLKPFPEKLAFLYKGHTATVRSIAVSNNGEYLATGCDDHFVRIFETVNGRLVKRYEVNGPVMQVAFSPNPALNILAVACEYQVLFFVPIFMACDEVNEHSIRFMKAPQIFTSSTSAAATSAAAGVGGGDEEDGELTGQQQHEQLRGRGVTQAAQDQDETILSAAQKNSNQARDLDDEAEKNIRADFVDTTPVERQAGIVVKVVLHSRVRRMCFHNKGDYMALLCPKDHVKYRQTIMLQLSARKVFCPFRKFSEIVTDCKFHPTEPYFFLSTTNSIRCYNLLAHKLVSRFKAPGGLTTCLSIHPEGENFIVGDSTAHTQWFDTEFSEKAYRRLKSHRGVVNEVAFHPNTGAYPLFASASSDGQVHVFHGMVYDDYSKNALIVPVKILKHTRPCYAIAWHPTLPWIFSSTDDGTVCCWTE